MYLDYLRIMNPIIRSHLMIHMDMVHPKHRFIVVTTLCSLEHLTDQILLPTYLDGLFHSRTYHHPEDTSQSQSLSERSEISYNPERMPYGMNIQEYGPAWIEGWTDVSPDYVDHPDIYERHRHSMRN